MRSHKEKSRINNKIKAIKRQANIKTLIYIGMSDMSFETQII